METYFIDKTTLLALPQNITKPHVFLNLSCDIWNHCPTHGKKLSVNITFLFAGFIIKSLYRGIGVMKLTEMLSLLLKLPDRASRVSDSLKKLFALLMNIIGIGNIRPLSIMVVLYSIHQTLHS
jgi:hypothetical protein